MPQSLILASGSEIRGKMLSAARVPFSVIKPKVDEESVKAALQAEGVPPRDVADALAELKALKISDRFPEAFVLGCDQVLDHAGRLLSKPVDAADAMAQLRGLQGSNHRLFSAAVIAQGGRPLWRHVGQVTLTMRPLSGQFIAAYVGRNWDSIATSVGGYKLEEEGARLFTRVQGDYFTVLGLPLLEVLDYLVLRGVLET
jgi:septum formation protein